VYYINTDMNNYVRDIKYRIETPYAGPNLLTIIILLDWVED